MSKQPADLIRTGGDKFGLDDQSSSIIVANLGPDVMPICKGQALTTDEMMTDDFHIIIFALDASPSMEDVIQAVRDAFNDFVIPGLMEASELVGAIRVGGFMFSEEIRPLWGGGFYPLDELPPLGAEYRDFGYSTALNKAALTAATATVSHALEIHGMTRSKPDITVVVFSDGANREPQPIVADVSKVYEDLDARKITTAFVGFQTWENTLRGVDFVAIARALGFKNIQNIRADDPNETPEDKRRRLRHGFNVFSQRLSGTVSKTVVPKASDVGGINVWED